MRDDNGVHGPTGQAIYGLSVDPGDGERVYALDDHGAFYRGNDAGANWSSTTAPLSSFTNSTADAIQVDPLRLSTLLITSDAGMAISTDAGLRWHMVSSIPGGVDVYDAAFSGANPDVAYAATSQGIYQTVDGGSSWQPEQTGIPAGTNLVVVAVDPRGASTVVSLSDGGLIFRSTDGGTPRTRVADTNGLRVLSLVFDPAHPGTALVGTEQGNALFISTDDGITWQRTDPGFDSGAQVVSLAAAVRQPLPTDSVSPPAPGTSGVYYASATHHSIRGGFLSFYNSWGGLRIFGLPLTEAFTEHGVSVQFFERAEFARINSHVELIALGALLTRGRIFPPALPGPNSATRTYFPSTRHSLSGAFLHFGRPILAIWCSGCPSPSRCANRTATALAASIWCNTFRMVGWSTILS